MSKKETLIIIFLFVFSFLSRVLFLDRYPPGVYTDEAAVGYSAYSVLKTGRDEFGSFMPLAFKSFNDYKAPVYIYSVVLSIFCLGLNAISIRLPSVLISSLTVVISYLLFRELFKKRKDFVNLSFIGSLLISLSPLHFTFSRIAFEGNMSLFFTILGVYLFLLARKRGCYYSLSLISFSLSIYSYHSARLVVPFLVLGLIVIYKREVFGNFKKFLIGVLIAFLFCLPLVYVTFTHFDEVVRRPGNVSIFKDKGVEGKLWEASVFDIGIPVLVVRLFHNKLHYYFLSFLRNYLTHFSGGYLFLHGDMGEHFRVPSCGVFYLVMLPFFINGIFKIFEKWKEWGKLIILWLILAPVAAGFTYLVPSGHRNLNLVVPFCLICGLGINAWAKTKKRKGVVFLLFLVNIAYFFYQYLYTAPMTMAKDWNWGYKEAVEYIKKVEGSYEKIVLSNDSGEAYMHFLFYSKYPPKKFQEKVDDFDEVDKFGIGHIYKFDKYEFRNIDWDKEKKKKGILWVGKDKEIPDNNGDLNYLKTTYYPSGEKAFEAVELAVEGRKRNRSNFKLVYGWGDCKNEKRYVLIIGGDKKINYQSLLQGRIVKEEKRNLTDGELEKVLSFIPGEIFLRYEDELRDGKSNFCSDLTLLQDDRRYRLLMQGKTFFMVDELLVYLNKIWKEKF